MLAGAAQANAAAHIGLVGELRGDVPFAAQRGKALEHRLGTARAEPVEPARLEEGAGGVGGKAAQPGRTVLGRRVHLDAEVRETGGEQEIGSGPRAQHGLDVRGGCDQAPGEEVQGAAP